MCAVKIGRLGKFDLNPRGEIWRKDENRFGHKLLSKFGWNQGKGLGKNEDGIIENLKVRIKMGHTGIGWDEKLPIGIDYREYDAVLKNLSKKYQKASEIKNEDSSLEKRSQQFKNRIHYQKFVRGKDISQYSEKDMSCIFLSKETEKKTECTYKESTVTNIESQPAGFSAKESVPTFNSQLSIADYFAMKMKNKIGSSLTIPKESEKDEFPPSETDVISKKRKHEFKSSKKAKRMKHETEFNTVEESLSNEQKCILQPSGSSVKKTEDNLVSEEQFQNIEELCNSETIKKKKKTKGFCNELKAKQDIKNSWQGEKNVSKSSFNSPEESNNVTEEEIICKQRKKENKFSKKIKKHCLGEAKISTVEENFSLVNESDGMNKSSKECTSESIKNENLPHKGGKKHKNKTVDLKSCLKGCLNNNKYSFKQKKNVSFCENISYQIIENVLSNLDSDVLETNEQLSCSDEDCTENGILNEAECIELNNHVDESGESSKDDKHTNVPCHENVMDADVIEDNTVPECFKLPKRSSTNYDSWLETQRIAATMKVYKNMVKRIKKHPILRKTNLLEIKGYGNWGAAHGY